ncbi:MAG TPA: tRNA lysidine(34) synthetase TilS, partial [Nitrospirota bacterium]|nr:tRNA lysidine(34) synthetase TilS [Nitrospirota bacterium]
MLLAKIKRTIQKYRMLDPGDRVIVAVSGGPDSVCLLAVLRELAPEFSLTLHIAHLDHMFRGEESAAEARFVRELADRLGIPATIEQHDVPAFCRERGLPPQAGAREVRYAFLDRVAGATGAQKIALGHTASDQAETLLLRLLRGAGISGLSGIPPKRGRIIRPLIEVTRDEVLCHLQEQGITFVTDPSNLKSVYTRNRIRLELVPVLKAFNPRIEETIAEEAEILRDEDEAMEARIAATVPAVILREDDTIRIRRDGFNAQFTAIRRRLFRTAVAMLFEGGEPELSSIQTEEALGFIGEAQTGRVMDLPDGLCLEREYDTFLLRPKVPPKEFQTTLMVPGITSVAELSLEVETRIVDALTLPGDFPSPQGKGEGGKGLLDEISLWQAVLD